jgi:hypothetical protein
MKQTDHQTRPEGEQPLQINLGKHTFAIADSMADIGALSQKLSDVRKDVQYIEKTGENDYHGYSYVTERDLTEKIRKPLSKVGVMLFTSVEEKGSQGDMTKVVTEHSFVDGDTGATITVKSRGHGYDEQDKGIYKAVTGAVKYLLYKNFLIPAGDDPEEPPTIGKNQRKKILAGAKKFAIPRDQFDDLLEERFGITDAGQLHPDQINSVRGMIQSKGTHPSKQNGQQNGQKQNGQNQNGQDPEGQEQQTEEGSEEDA